MLSIRSLFIALLSAPLVVLAQSTANSFKVPEGFSGSAGSPLTLNWTPTTSGTITLVLRTGNSANLEAGSIIASSIPNSGSYTWQIPADTVRNSDYAVEIVDDSDPSTYNFTPYFVIDSTVTVATTSASLVSLGAATSSVALSTAQPTATALTASSGLSSQLAAASTSGSSASAQTTGSSTLATSASTTTGSSTTGSSSSAASSASAGFQSTTSTTNAAPRTTAMAGMLGLVALGALAL